MVSNSYLNNAEKIASNRLCTGCGACFAVCPTKNIQLIEFVEDGIRPILKIRNCGYCRLCEQACPGLHAFIPDTGKRNKRSINHHIAKWGFFSDVWEGYASDPEIRLKGSSGGLCTALSLFCLEQGYASNVLHIGSDREIPWRNKTFLSTNREELLARTGSRYSPASPCDGLGLIESGNGETVFIGKPCDVTGLRLMQQLKPEISRKTALAIGFFCAGTPSTDGTLSLLKSHGVTPEAVASFRYRGMGWPGMATAEFKDAAIEPLKLSYDESWGYVQKYRPFRCYICPDLTAEMADISVGDPWYRDRGDNDPGRSLIIIRTERGRTIFKQAMEQGYVSAERCPPEIISLSQGNLLRKRQAIWGRLFAMRLLGVPRPDLRGYHLLANWLSLPLSQKIKSILGTIRRIVQRKYYKPLQYDSPKNRKIH